MHIADKLGQYSRNLNNGTEELRSAQGVQKLVSTVRDMSAGSVFEGTVNQVRGGKVVLALGNGQLISARLDGKVDIKQGSSMFFQVKSNEGGMISIRPFNGVGNASNPILLHALTAAQVPVTDRTLMMVDAMMQEQMSVDKQSILNMVKVLSANPESNVQTIVQMTKHGLPVSEAMATQFEHYLTDQHALLNEMELAVGQIAESLGDETMTPGETISLYNKVVDIFLGKGETAFGGGMNAGSFWTAGNVIPGGADGSVVLSGTEGNIIPEGAEGSVTSGTMTDENGLRSMMADVSEGETAEALTGGMRNTPAGLEGTQAEKLLTFVTGGRSAQTGAISQSNAVGAGVIYTPSETLGAMLSETQLEILGKTLQDMPTLIGNTTLFVKEGAEEVFVDTLQDDAVIVSEMDEAVPEAETVSRAVLNKDLHVTDFFKELQFALTESSVNDYTGPQKLFAGKEFQILLRGMVEQQWLLHPKELKEEGRIEELYEKMERQMGQLETAMRAVGIEQNSFLQTAADIRGNIEFMNQMNQIYQYVQLPLKMSGQHANGELYVYTNKKALQDPEAELTAFLHLEMDTLGTTDVSVRMIDRKVKTNFYFEDDASYELVEKHLPILERRLNKKGYSCTITVTNEKRMVNFKENFLKKGSGTSRGSVHRYSFDVRA